ncbi:uncharacterized protein [Typha latifolia]|uniref:uncharacterized protein isoform X4 n=1 Tax=Typha latifolia TaxID=4733 RepID=UPI003C2F34BF
MGPESLNGYSYGHLGQKAPQAIDVHEIFVRKNRLRVLLSYVGTITLLASIYCSVMAKEHLCVSSIWSILVGILVAKCLEYKPVKKESVVIMPAFGVQLETHFWRRTSRNAKKCAYGII